MTEEGMRGRLSVVGTGMLCYGKGNSVLINLVNGFSISKLTEQCTEEVRIDLSRVNLTEVKEIKPAVKILKCTTDNITICNCRLYCIRSLRPFSILSFQDVILQLMLLVPVSDRDDRDVQHLYPVQCVSGIKGHRLSYGMAEFYSEHFQNQIRDIHRIHVSIFQLIKM